MSKIGKKAFSGDIFTDIAVMKDKVMDDMNVSELPIPEAFGRKLVTLNNVSQEWRAVVNQIIPNNLAVVAIRRFGKLKWISDDDFMTEFVSHPRSSVQTQRGYLFSVRTWVYDAETCEKLLANLDIDQKYIRPVLVTLSFQDKQTRKYTKYWQIHRHFRPQVPVAL